MYKRAIEIFENHHLPQIYNYVLKRKAPIGPLKIYIAAYDILDEVEWDYDEGWTLQHEEHYRYYSIQKFINKYLAPARK